MLLLLAGLCLAGTVDEVRSLEWSRAPAAEVAAFAGDEDPAVRAVVATALGRLRDPAAVEPLVALLGDDEVDVRRAAAEALGYTPGAAPHLRAALDAHGPEDSNAVAVRLIEALGHQGGPEDVDRLISLLALPWPQVGAAAEALGRLARREVQGVGRSVDALNGCARRPANHTAEACAWALWRVGLEHGDSNDVSRAAWRARTGSSAVLRERMLRAAWPHLEDRERRELFEHALLDPARGTRAAALSMVQAGQVDPSDVVPLLASRDPWIWETAAGALGRLGGEEAVAALEDQLEDAPAWKREVLALALVTAGAREADPAEEAPPDEDDSADLPVDLPDLDPGLSGAIVHTTRGSFRIELDTEVAPIAANNFARLAEADFYDRVSVHRVVPGFVIQTGCPVGDGTGGPGWRIPDEVSAEPWVAGAVGMARAERDTGGSQWFVTTGVHPHLEGEYTWFGRVSQGMEVVRVLSRGDVVLDVLIERAR